MLFDPDFLRRIRRSVPTWQNLSAVVSPSEAADELEILARRLEATGDYRILRRVAPRSQTFCAANSSDKIGVVIDLETTGLDHNKDEIIELAMLKFGYSERDEITGVLETFQAFNQPSNPIPANITRITGITDTMVAGHRIDGLAIESFVSDANCITAHHASYDRKFAEHAFPIFGQKPWACSMTQINWQEHGFSGVKLSYLLADAGYFHNAHRALDDCHATLVLLTRPLSKTSTTAFAILMDHARRRTFRIWAQHASYDLKEALKRRGYHWNPGTDGGPRSWYIDVEESKRDAEMDFLRREIYQRDVDLDCREVTALDRFSVRV